MGFYTISNQKVEIEIHKIIQYLASAANSFLPKKKDDSHINLKSLVDCGCLITRPLNSNGDVLAFNYEAFSIEWWCSSGEKEMFKLNHKTHQQIVKWITTVAFNNGITKPYKRLMSYELPYQPLADMDVYYLEGHERLREIIHYRILAHLALEDTLQDFHPHSEIRVWPHHFNIASTYTLNKNKHHIIRLGMAMPDYLSDTFYLYVKGYAKGEAIGTRNLRSMKHGSWNHNYEGAIMPLDSTINIIKAQQFFKEAIKILKEEGRVDLYAFAKT